MTRRSPLARAEGVAMTATPQGGEPLDPAILRIIQALARADEAADYASHPAGADHGAPEGQRNG